MNIFQDGILQVTHNILSINEKLFQEGKDVQIPGAERGDYLTLAPPPEYAASGGWALRGTPPKGLSSRPAKGTTESLVEAGDDGGGRRQLAATLGRIYPYRAAKQQAPGVAAAGA